MSTLIGLLSGPINANPLNDNTINAMGGFRYLSVEGEDCAEGNEVVILNTDIPLDGTMIYAECGTVIKPDIADADIADENYNEGVTG